jgi:hypothetical protein
VEHETSTDYMFIAIFMLSLLALILGGALALWIA